MFPRIHLAVDNCFASKRWTAPDEWMQIAADVGLAYVEASADNECDSLYTPPDVLDDWIDAVQTAGDRFSVRVCNLYSGHGTYATLGLAHPDVRVGDHIQHHWLEPMIRWAAQLGAGLGFFCHAFSQATLADPNRYIEVKTDLYRRCAELTRFAAEQGITSLGVEQMYSPHQIPWTIRGTQELLRAVRSASSSNFYITLDTGHQVGQRRFLRPTEEQIEQALNGQHDNNQPVEPWLGYLAADQDDLRRLTVRDVMTHVDKYPYLFSEPADTDLYEWIEMLGAWSPIIHLQQTDGTSSAHRPFTETYNRTGIVNPVRVLQALHNAYQTMPTGGYPAACTDIYLTLEFFSGTADRPADILRALRESVTYWRQVVPEDGLPLDQLVSHMPAGQ